MKTQDMIKNINHAQTQKQLYSLIISNQYGTAILAFVFQHYNSVYNASLHAWTHTRSYKPVDLNEAQTMTSAAVRALKRRA